MIKKWFGWFDVYYAEMLLGVAFAIMNACTGSWSVALVWLAFSFSCGIFKLVISEKNRRYKALVNLSKEIQSNEKKLCRQLYGLTMSYILKCNATD